MRIRDEKNSDPEYKKIRIRVKHPGSATLVGTLYFVLSIVTYETKEEGLEEQSPDVGEELCHGVGALPPLPSPSNSCKEPKGHAYCIIVLSFWDQL
jgi:hypothetical protein